MAWLIGRGIGQDPSAGIVVDADAVLWGVLMTQPMLLGLAITLRVPWAPLKRLRQFFRDEMHPLLADCNVLDLALLAASAGIGEELLFRGLIQGGLTHWVGIAPALVLSSILFGLAHPITPAYAVIVALLGVYLGWTWLTFGNLLVPMIAHGLYDFLALVWLLRFEFPSDATSRDGGIALNSVAVRPRGDILDILGRSVAGHRLAEGSDSEETAMDATPRRRAGIPRGGLILAVVLLCQMGHSPPSRADEEPTPAATRQFAVAVGFQSRGLYGLAADEWKRFLNEHAKDPRGDQARHYLGVCLLQDDKLDEAIGELARVAREHPKYDGLDAVHLNLGIAHFRKGERDKNPGELDAARREFETVLNQYGKSPEAPKAAYYRAEAWYRAGKLDEAIRSL